MDTTILEVVLGLVLIYAVLAVLVMKLQEELGGNLLNYRANVLHDLVLEACGGSQDLKQQVLAHPLVFALYRDTSAQQRTVRPDKGPSAVPPALFAKALLAVLNGGSAPSLAGPPATFLAPAMPPGAPNVAGAALAKTNGDGDGRQRIWQVLQTLLPGHEADWPGFEAAVAQWFSDIGDRADGWFKRKASRWALVLSIVLVGLLNVDSFHIATALGHDPALRLGVADLATRIESQRRSDAAGQGDLPAPPSAAAQPMQQLASRMTDAITQLNSAWRSDEAIGRYQADITPVHRGCSIVRDASALDSVHALTVDELADIKGITASAAALAKKAKGPPATVVGGVLSWSASLSNADIWLRVLPIVQAKVEVAQLLGAAQAARTYQRAYECVAQVSSWVRSATVASDKGAVRAQMQDAAAALEAVKSALLTLSQQQQASTSLRRAFLTDPVAFSDCSHGATSRNAFDACLQRELRAGLNLPVFWGGTAMRTQFCTAVDVTNKNADVPATATAAKTGLFCGETPFAGNSQLGLPALHLKPRDGWPWLAAISGWAVTVLFVALGAPFWFDLMSKVVRLRSAGTVRDATDEQQRGRGNQALPVPLPGGTTGAADGEAPFSDSRNAYEDRLTPANILRLQQRLPADQTGRLDHQTRAALRSWCTANGEQVVDELNDVLYLRIVGRAVTPAAAGTGSARLAIGQTHAGVATLAAALMPVLRQNGRITSGITVFDADLRALAVLFRYHQDRQLGKAPKDCAVMQLAGSSPAQMDEIDDVLAAQIDDAAKANQRIALEPPCWMDWAIGELGQVEHDARNRAASNPRIVAYLDAAARGAGNDGDHTAWCGAFVAWALSTYDSYRRAHVADTERQGDPLATVGAVALPTVTDADWPLRASSWAAWGTPHADWRAGAQFGDVVLFKRQGKDSSGHVAFVVAWDGQQLWALGGNQSNGSRVSMQPWAADQVVAVMHL